MLRRVHNHPRFVGSHRNDLDTQPNGPNGNFSHWQRFSGMRFAGYERCYKLVHVENQTQLVENFAHVIAGGAYALDSQGNYTAINFKDNGNLFTGGTDVPYRLPVQPYGWGGYMQVYWVDWDAVDTQELRDNILDERSDVLQSINDAKIKYWLVDNQPEWYTAIKDWRTSLGYPNSADAYAEAHMNALVSFLKSIKDLPVFANVYSGYTGFSVAEKVFDGIYFEAFYWLHTAQVLSPDTYDAGTARLTGRSFKHTALRVLRALRRGKLLMFRIPQLRREEVPLCYKLVRLFPRALFDEHRYTPTGRHISPSSLFSRQGIYIHPAS